MRVLSFITDTPTVQTILHHLALPHRPPPLTPARAPPQAELEFDQTSTLPSLRSGEPAGHEIACREDLGPHGFDPSDPEPLPEPDFAQSPPGHWDA
ncbi:MAG: hypothetical protein WEG36_00830 [Gemmatimonadota bacterium]